MMIAWWALSVVVAILGIVATCFLLFVICVLLSELREEYKVFREITNIGVIAIAILSTVCLLCKAVIFTHDNITSRIPWYRMPAPLGSNDDNPIPEHDISPILPVIHDRVDAPIIVENNIDGDSESWFELNPNGQWYRTNSNAALIERGNVKLTIYVRGPNGQYSLSNNYEQALSHFNITHNKSHSVLEDIDKNQVAITHFTLLSAGDGGI